MNNPFTALKTIKINTQSLFPSDVLELIFNDRVIQKSDLYNLTLTNRLFYLISNPMLWSDLIIKCNNSETSLFPLLLENGINFNEAYTSSNKNWMRNCDFVRSITVDGIVDTFKLTLDNILKVTDRFPNVVKFKWAFPERNEVPFYNLIWLVVPRKSQLIFDKIVKLEFLNEGLNCNSSQNILQQIPLSNIKILSFSNVYLQKFRFFSKFLSNLESLEIKEFYLSQANEDLGIVLKSCSKLKEFKFSAIDNISSVTFEVILKNLKDKPRLQELGFSNLSISDFRNELFQEILKTVGKKLIFLQLEFNQEEVSRFQSQDLSCLYQTCKNLNRLSLKHKTHLWDLNFEDFKNFKELKYLFDGNFEEYFKLGILSIGITLYSV
ncbi:hypothetical protein HK099_000223 [Clydaea vesicula]|uniref:F-box domain-containing protein n=1 Tax=Clydaea vesicula TaxID=447962 RepID=A0AAD5Y298_9FUNG|nr:hypothetical protein HK099_000223 [Clydaea vesicula]